MALWLLKRTGRTPYDMTAGLVVRASSERGARGLAYDSAYDSDGNKGEPCWLDKNATTCERIANDGPAEVILVDFRAG